MAMGMAIPIAINGDGNGDGNWEWRTIYFIPYIFFQIFFRFTCTLFFVFYLFENFS